MGQPAFMLRASSGVKSGDEVISTPMTAEPTNTSILYTGAKVVWSDVDPKTGNMCQFNREINF